MAITSAPSVTDIGLSSTSSGPGRSPSTNRIPPDQPVASAIGISGTAAARGERRTTSSTRNTPTRAASSVSARRAGDESAPLASAASTGRPTTAALTPVGRVEAVLDVVHHLLLAVERHQPDPERQVGGLAVARDHALGEVGRAPGEAAARTFALVGARGAEEVGQRERRAELGRAALLGAALALPVAVRAQHVALEARHPGEHRRTGDVVGAHRHVDLAGHAGGLLELVHVAQRLEVLRHELLDVGHHLALGVEHEAEHRHGQPDGQHLARAREGHPERAPGAIGQPLARARAAADGAPAPSGGPRRRPRRGGRASAARRSAPAPRSPRRSRARAPPRCRARAGGRSRAPSAPARAAARGSPPPWRRRPRRSSGRRPPRPRPRPPARPRGPRPARAPRLRARCSSKRAWNWIA